LSDFHNIALAVLISYAVSLLKVRRFICIPIATKGASSQGTGQIARAHDRIATWRLRVRQMPQHLERSSAATLVGVDPKTLRPERRTGESCDGSWILSKNTLPIDQLMTSREIPKVRGFLFA